jgi:hypothetical protein
MSAEKSWESDVYLHARKVMDALNAKYGLTNPDMTDFLEAQSSPHGNGPEFFRDDSTIAHYAAALVATRLEEKTVQEHSAGGRVVPEGWTPQESFKIADMAYQVGRLSREKVNADDAAMTMRYYIYSALEMAPPGWPRPVAFEKMVFHTKNAGTISGEELLEKAARQRRSFSPPSGPESEGKGRAQ